MKRQMIRVIALLLVLLLVGGILASVVLAAPGDRTVEVSEEIAGEPLTITSAQLIGDTLYLVAGTTLYTLAAGGETLEMLYDFQESMGDEAESLRLISDGETLYVLQTKSGKLYTWDGSAATELVQLDYDGLGEELEDGTLSVDLTTPMVVDGALLALYRDPADYFTMPLLRFSLEDGRYERLSGSSTLQQLAAYKDGQLLGLELDYMSISPDSKPMVVVINAKTGAKTQEIGSLSTYTDGGIAYDAENDRVYAVSGSQVVQVGQDGLTPVNYLSGSNASYMQYAAVWGGEYLLLSYSGLNLRNTDPQYLPENPLRILGPNYAGALIKDFSKENPDVAVLEQNEFIYETEALTTSILSGTDSADIYLLTSYSEVQDLIAKGYLDPLDSQIIQEDVGSMYPQLQDLLMNDGKVYGVPMMFSPGLWSVREDLLEEFGYEMPKSLKEYYEMMIQWDEDFAADNTDYTFDNELGEGKERARLFAINTVLTQYALTYEKPGEPLRFDTPEFREMLEVLEQLPYEAQEEDANAVTVYSFTAGEEQKELFNSYTSDILGRYYRMSDSEAPQATIMTPPPFTEGDEPQYMAYTYFYVLNPNSQNKEEAMRFLEYVSQHRDVEAEFLTHPDKNDIPEIEGYEDRLKDLEESLADAKERLQEAAPEDRQTLEETVERLEGYLANTDDNRWEFSEEALANYRAVAPYMNFLQDSLLMDMNNTGSGEAFQKIVMRYLNGQDPMDKMIQELDNMFMKMYQERR